MLRPCMLSKRNGLASSFWTRSSFKGILCTHFGGGGVPRQAKKHYYYFWNTRLLSSSAAGNEPKGGLAAAKLNQSPRSPPRRERMKDLWEVGRSLIVNEMMTTMTTQTFRNPSDEEKLAQFSGDNWKSMSWNQYLLTRGFLHEKSYAKALPEERDAATQFLSSYLTYPLSLAHHWGALTEPFQRNSSNSMIDKAVKVCVVGADSEVDYPVFWKELVLLVGCAVDLEFIGPRIDEKPLWAIVNDEKLKIKQTRGSLEDVVFTRGGEDAVDIFVAFQPGPGTNQQYTWEEGFDIIRDTGKPLLITAYDARDADRDTYWWEYTLHDKLAPYQTNPWASTRGYGGIQEESSINGVVTILT